MKLHFSDFGQGIPVIFLHGFPFDHRAWDLLTPHLEDEHHFIFPDLRGFGASSVNTTQFSLGEMARDVIGLMDNIGARGAIIAGHSMGGYIALELLKQIPSRIFGVILVASHIYADSAHKKKQRLETIEKLRMETPEKVFATMPTQLSAHEEVQKYCERSIEQASVAGLQGALYAMAGRSSSESIWACSDIPKLLLAGGKDAFISKSENVKMAECGKNVLYKEFKHAGHMLMREHPAKTASFMLNFIKEIRRD